MILKEVLKEKFFISIPFQSSTINWREISWPLLYEVIILGNKNEKWDDSKINYKLFTPTKVIRPVNLHPLFLKIGHPAFWKLGTLFFEKSRVQKNMVIFIQKEKRQPALFSLWIKTMFFSACFLQKAGCPIFKKQGARFLRIVVADLLGKCMPYKSADHYIRGRILKLPIEQLCQRFLSFLQTFWVPFQKIRQLWNVLFTIWLNNRALLPPIKLQIAL